MTPPAARRRPDALDARPGVRRLAARCARGALCLALLLAALVAPQVAAPAAEASPGQGWTQLTPGTSPGARKLPAMAYDPATAQMLLFGGSTTNAASTATSTTWSWTGTTWTQLTPATSPPARSGAALAWDPATAQLILFGGYDTSGAALGDTWSWDGSTWINITPANAAQSPSARAEPAMAFDSATSQLVLFGGVSGSTFSNETWSWNGTTWAKRSGTTPPSARMGSALTYVPSTGQLLLFGGMTSATTAVNDTWSWDGARWTQLTPATTPSVRARPAAVFDPHLGRVVLVSGCAVAPACQDTWTWTGTDWYREALGTGPSSRAYPGAAYDPRIARIVLYGGTLDAGSPNAETWTYGPDPATGPGWVRAATTGPSGRAGQATGFDAATGQLLLFGGYDGTGVLNDTWVWDGSAWTNVTPAGGSPPARKYSTLAYDPQTGQMLLFGGQGASAQLGDTWAWSMSGGTGSWTNVTPGTSPSARSGASMGFDLGTGQMLLFGGIAAGTAQKDTWQWTGTGWTQLGSTFSSPRAFTSLLFDQRTGQMLLQGGNDGSITFGGTFAWNGTSNWTGVSPGNFPGSGIGSAKDFDAALGASVIWDPLNRLTWTWDGSAWSTILTSASSTAPPGWTGTGNGKTHGDTTATFDPSTGQLVVMGGYTSPGSYATETWVLTNQPELAGAATASGATTLNGYDRTIAMPTTIEVDDPVSAGWNVSVLADAAPTSGASTLPALVLNGSGAGSPSGTTAPVPTCVAGSCTAPSGGAAVGYPLTVPTSTAATVFRAAGGTGIGRTGLPVTIWARVPARTRPGTYTSTITVTVGSGP